MSIDLSIFDVMVVGGGTAGVIAAIQAARAGAQTVLVECTSQLGGTITTGGVSFPGLFHAHGKQVIRGIGWELVEETVRMNNDILPDFTKACGTHHPKHQIRINPYLYTLIAEEKCIQAGVHLRYYETPVKAIFNDKNWLVEVIGKGTRESINCKQIIDCTGNALIAQIAGYDVVRSKICQPGSMIFKLGGYKFKRNTKNLIHQAFKPEEALDKTWEELGKGFNHISGANSTTSMTHTTANIKGRTTLLKMVRILRSLPSLEKITIQSMCSETSVRETYRIDGMHEITVDEYLSGKQYMDAVCNSFYPIDVHDKEGVKIQYLNVGVVPSVPLRSLIPKNSINFLVAGRCVSSDQGANSALRVQASCMAMGQAAGAISALAAKRNETPFTVPLKEILTLLRKHGAIIPNNTKM
jgi:FAD dependent oxidoreductase